MGLRRHKKNTAAAASAGTAASGHQSQPDVYVPGFLAPDDPAPLNSAASPFDVRGSGTDLFTVTTDDDTAPSGADDAAHAGNTELWHVGVHHAEVTDLQDAFAYSTQVLTAAAGERVDPMFDAMQDEHAALHDNGLVAHADLPTAGSADDGDTDPALLVDDDFAFFPDEDSVTLDPADTVDEPDPDTLGTNVNAGDTDTALTHDPADGPAAQQPTDSPDAVETGLVADTLKPLIRLGALSAEDAATVVSGPPTPRRWRRR